jgi:hypothetical protein
MKRLGQLMVALVVLSMGAAQAEAPATTAPAKAAAKKEPVTTKASKSRGDAKEDKEENLKKFKFNFAAPKPGANVCDTRCSIRPPSKGGPKTRGDLCGLAVDNRTAYVIDIYVEGNMMGTVGAYGDAAGFFEPGEMKVQGRAEFDDGSVLKWGPKILDCQGITNWVLSE